MEEFINFTRENFVKMWRTLKAESGDRITKCRFGHMIDNCTLRALMQRMEDRMEEELERHAKDETEQKKKVEKLIGSLKISVGDPILVKEFFCDTWVLEDYAYEDEFGVSSISGRTYKYMARYTPELEIFIGTREQLPEMVFFK